MSRVWAAWAGQAVGQRGQQHGTGRPGRVRAAGAECRQVKQWGSAGRAWAGPDCTEPHRCAYGSRGGSMAAGTEPAGRPGSAATRSCVGRLGLPAGALPYPERLCSSTLFGEAPCQGEVAMPCAMHRCNNWRCCNCHLWRLCLIIGRSKGDLASQGEYPLFCI